MTTKNPKITDFARTIKARYNSGVEKHQAAGSGVICAACATPGRLEKHQNGRRIKDHNDVMFTLTSQEPHGVVIGNDDEPALRIRRLTPRECWRLQGFPDEYFDKAQAAGVSMSQLYKQAGNAVTVTVARAIGERLKEVEEQQNE